MTATPRSTERSSADVARAEDRGTDVARADRSVPLLVAAAVLVLLVVGAVVLFGVDRPPSVASLAEEPDPAPTAAVAWTAQEGERTCVRIAWPDGRTTEPRCATDGGEVVGWTSDGVLLRRWDDDQVRVLDPRSGALLGRGPQDRLTPTHEDAAVWTEHRDGELIVRSQADDTELWRVPAPDRYTIRSSSRSADGGWVAMIDSAERLLVVAADGSVAPREWAAGGPAWQPPVWEGATRDR
jgi:hypothetical protein